MAYTLISKVQLQRGLRLVEITRPLVRLSHLTTSWLLYHAVVAYYAFAILEVPFIETALSTYTCCRPYPQELLPVPHDTF